MDGQPATTETAAGLQGFAGTGPDLVETSVSDPPMANMVAGTSFPISDTVQNSGTASAGASTTKYFLTLDGTHAASGTKALGSRAVAALNAGAMDSGSATATIQAGTPQGTYRLLACADATNAVTESSETNNCIASTGSVTISAPDLTESMVSASPAVVDSMSTLDITETLNNISMTDATTSTTRFHLSTDTVLNSGDGYVRACVSGQVTPGRTVSSLAGGASSTGTTTVDLCVVDGSGLHRVAAGTYYVIACADELQQVAEIDESNNCSTSATTIQVTVCGNGIIEPGEACDDGNTTSGDGCSSTCQLEAAPDLIETTITEPPMTAVQGGTFDVTDTTQNQSMGQTAGASTTRYYLSLDRNKSTGDPALTGSRAVPVLLAGASSNGMVTVTIPTSVPGGSYYLLACADADNTVAETDETNNCIASTGTVSITGPDLVESSVSDPQGPVTVGGSFSMTDTVQNLGSVDAGASTSRYFLSLDRVHAAPGTFQAGDRSVPAVAAGASNTGMINVTIRAGTPAGTYYMLVCADKTNQVVETNEANNCTASTGTVVVSGPDLTESNVSVPASVTAGGTMDITETVNDTTMTAAGASVTRFFLSTDATKSNDDHRISQCTNGQPLPSRSVPALGGGASNTGTTTVPLCFTDGSGTHPIAPGTYFVFACADDTQQVAETNEKNNCTVSGSFTVN